MEPDGKNKAVSQAIKDLTKDKPDLYRMLQKMQAGPPLQTS